MKRSSSLTPRVLLALAIIALILITVIWQQNRKGEKTPPAVGSSAHSPSEDNRNSQRPPRESPREADRLLKAEGARTDVTLSSFPTKEYQHLPAPAGKPASSSVGVAYIHVPSAGRRIAMEPNQIGEFPAIETQLNDIVGVRLSFDAVKPGTPVRVVIMDGGSFPTAQGAAQVLKATKWGGIAFEFTTSGNIGFHRVLVHAQGHSSRILNFNAADGDTWPARSTASTN